MTGNPPSDRGGKAPDENGTSGNARTVAFDARGDDRVGMVDDDEVTPVGNLRLKSAGSEDALPRRIATIPTKSTKLVSRTNLSS